MHLTDREPHQDSSMRPGGAAGDITLETERLILRRWREGDLSAFIEMSADPTVMEWIGGTFTPERARAAVDRIEARFETLGYGHFVAERKKDGLFMGIAGLAPMQEGPAFPQGVTIGGRMIRAFWGLGYPIEAGRVLFRDAFDRVGLPEILAFTAPGNLRSQALMKRMGLTRDPSRDFDHPDYAEGHPLRRHLAYFIRPGAPIAP